MGCGTRRVQVCCSRSPPYRRLLSQTLKSTPTGWPSTWAWCRRSYCEGMPTPAISRRCMADCRLPAAAIIWSLPSTMSAHSGKSKARTSRRAFFLLAEHRAHVLPWLPWLFLAACLLMHVFMHHGHGGHHHGGNGGSEGRPNAAPGTGYIAPPSPGYTDSGSTSHHQHGDRS